jgi:threonine synthase
VRYVSTRGTAPDLSFSDALLAGLATDGGLYVPERWPQLPKATGTHTYAERAAQVMTPFVGDDISAEALLAMCRQAYSRFAHPAVVPLVQNGHHDFLQELFHGPTLAFKDVALQLVGLLFDHVLAADSRRITIVGATSGDTGSAAIDGVKSCANVDIVILYPNGRTSDVQRRQMTTVHAPNVRVVAIEGTFDDCQDLVKAMFNDPVFRDEMSLAAVNSINWARVMAQVVYYVVATDLLGSATFCVPSGNFGNVFSGYIAQQMGAPVDKLVVASNANDILTRFFNDNDMRVAPVVPSLSPSMDIQVSSNFERLLFEMNGRDGGLTAEQLHAFRAVGHLSVEPDQRHEHLARFLAGRIDDARTLEVMRNAHATSGMLLDPHTAVGVGVTHALRQAGALHGRVVTLATAHPAKFPDAVAKATGVHPALPAHLADLFDRPERFEVLPNDLATVQRYVGSTFR